MHLPNIYRTIEYLLKEGLIRESGEERDPYDDERRNIYEITEEGRELIGRYRKTIASLFNLSEKG